MEANKDERERALDAKIAAIRAKNHAKEQRQQEVMNDRKLAEKQNQSITTAPRLKGSEEEVQFLQERVGVGRRKNRSRDDIFSDSNGKKDNGKGKANASGRLGENEGPPPDPEYRFLADRFRDGSDDEDGGNGRDRGSVDGRGGRSREQDYRGGGRGDENWSRGGRGNARGRGSVDGRGGRSREQDYRGGGRGFSHEQSDQRWGHDRRMDNQGRRDQDHRMQGDQGRGGRGGNFNKSTRGNFRGNGDNFGKHVRDDEIEPFIKGMRRGSDQMNTRHSESNNREVLSKSEKNTSPRHKLKQPFTSPNNSGRNHSDLTNGDHDSSYEQPNIPTAMVSPRKIEESDGRLTVTKMHNGGHNQQRNETASSNSYNSHQRSFNRPETHSQIKPPPPFKEPRKPTPLNSNVVESDQYQRNNSRSHSQYEMPSSNWKCPDPGCKQLNSSKALNCVKCGIDFKAANDYISNFACDRVKQEYSNARKNQYSKGSYMTDGYTVNGYGENTSLTQSCSPSLPTPLLSISTKQDTHIKDWSADVEQQALSSWGLSPVDQHTNGGWAAQVSHEQMMYPQQLVGGQMVDPNHLQYNMMVQESVQVPSFPPPFFADVHHMPQGHNVHVAPFHPQTVVTTQNDWTTHDHYCPNGYGQEAQSNLAVFNPPTPMYMQPVTDSMYQTPPPVFSRAPNASFSSSHVAQPKKSPPEPANIKSYSSDSNLLLTLNKAPTPMALRRPVQEHRPKVTPDKFGKQSLTEVESPSAIHSSENSNSRISSRVQKPTEAIPKTAKPPSMIEMQSGSLKKGTFPAPPKGKGSGLIIFGNPNVVSHIDETLVSNELNVPVKVISTDTLGTFQEKSILLNPSRDWLVLLHGLGNDARNIAVKRMSDSDKATEADELANRYCDIIEGKILGAASHICVFVSMLLPRFDFQEKSAMANPNNVRKVINVQITQRLYENPRVSLINSDKILDWGEDIEKLNTLFQGDGHQLSKSGFTLIRNNWMEQIKKKMKESNFKPPIKSSNPVQYVQRTEQKSTTDKAIDSSNSPLSESRNEPNSANLKDVDENLVDKDGNESSSSDDTDTVPDPFMSYEAPCEVVKTRTISTSSAVLFEDNDDELDEDSIPNLETVHHNETKKVTEQIENISLINEASSKNLSDQMDSSHEDEFHDVDDGGFIDDSYCGDSLKSHDFVDQLPSMVSLGPSSDTNNASGHFLEDSYFPPTSGLGSMRTVEFCFQNSGTGVVKISGDFNEWQPKEMEKDGTLWKLLIDLPFGEYHYKYLVDGQDVIDSSCETTEKDGEMYNLMVVKTEGE